MGVDPPGVSGIYISVPTDKTRVSSLGYYGDTLFIAVLHDFAELLCRLGLDDGRTLSVILVQPVILKWSEIICCSRLI